MATVLVQPLADVCCIKLLADNGIDGDSVNELATRPSY